MKLYVVTSDEWDAGYGSEIYLLGVFDTAEKAVETAAKTKKKHASITEVTVNKHMKEYLGGYIE